MANQDENTNGETVKMQVGVMVEPDLFQIIEDLREQEDRTRSNMVERLLKTHPLIQSRLEGETVTA